MYPPVITLQYTESSMKFKAKAYTLMSAVKGKEYYKVFALTMVTFEMHTWLHIMTFCWDKIQSKYWSNIGILIQCT